MLPVFKRNVFWLQFSWTGRCGLASDEFDHWLCVVRGAVGQVCQYDAGVVRRQPVRSAGGGGSRRRRAEAERRAAAGDGD